MILTGIPLRSPYHPEDERWGIEQIFSGISDTLQCPICDEWFYRRHGHPLGNCYPWKLGNWNVDVKLDECCNCACGWKYDGFIFKMRSGEHCWRYHLRPYTNENYDKVIADINEQFIPEYEFLKKAYLSLDYETVMPQHVLVPATDGSDFAIVIPIVPENYEDDYYMHHYPERALCEFAHTNRGRAVKIEVEPGKPVREIS